MSAYNFYPNLQLMAGHTSGSVDLALSTVIPVGQSLVLDFISTSAEMPPGQKPSAMIALVDSFGVVMVQHYFVSRFQLTYLTYAGMPTDRHTSAHALRVEIDRNLSLRWAFVRDGTSGKAQCFFGISGHFEAG